MAINNKFMNDCALAGTVSFFGNLMPITFTDPAPVEVSPALVRVRVAAVQYERDLAAIKATMYADMRKAHVEFSTSMSAMNSDIRKAYRP